MLIVNHYIHKDQAIIEFKFNFIKDRKEFNRVHYLALSNGFKLNEYRNTYSKYYYAHNLETFQNDLDLLKSLFNHYRIRSYKLVNIDSNIGS